LAGFFPRCLGNYNQGFLSEPEFSEFKNFQNACHQNTYRLSNP
jgi:hypothetical protein